MARLFYERQSFRPRRMRILTAILPAAMLALTVVQVAFGLHWGKQSNGSLIGWTIFLWLVYWRLMTVKLVTEVRPDQLRVKMSGLWRWRRIPLTQITSATEVSFDPVRDWGGYGIRVTRRGRAYLSGGTDGVEVRTRNQGLFLVSSGRAAELARVLRESAGI